MFDSDIVKEIFKGWEKNNTYLISKSNYFEHYLCQTEIQKLIKILDGKIPTS